MTLYEWMCALAAAAGLALAALAAARGARSALSVPLALLAADQFVWNSATVFLSLTGNDAWRWLGAIAAPVFTPAALWFVLAFVGRLRSLRWLLWATAVAFGLQSAAALVGLLLPAADPLTAFAWLSAAHLACDLPVGAVGVTLIVRHWRRSIDPRERSRAGLLLVANFVFVAFAFTDLLADLGLPVPGLAAIGSFGFNALLSTLTFRLGVYDQRDRAAGYLTTAIAVLLVLVAYLGVFALARGRAALLLVGLGAVTLALFTLTRYTLAAWATERAGLERLAQMGRFTAQMAHDLKNPLAAARGAAQFLEEEVRQGRGLGQQQEFLGLISEQLDRLGRLIERYQRLGKLELSPAPLELNGLVEKVLALQTFAVQGEVTLQRELSPQPVPCTADADLLASALENLVKNAFEATPRGGTVTVRARRGHADGEVELEVQDTGAGMDERTRERAFDLFHTTKATGSGLGLHFVRQVAEAHGGQVALESREGWGTVVTLRLPAVARAPEGGSHG